MLAEAMGGGVEVAGLAGDVAGGMPGGLDIEDLNPEEPVALGVQHVPVVERDHQEEGQHQDDEDVELDEEDEEDEEDISVSPQPLVG